MRASEKWRKSYSRIGTPTDVPLLQTSGPSGLSSAKEWIEMLYDPKTNALVCPSSDCRLKPEPKQSGQRDARFPSETISPVPPQGRHLSGAFFGLRLLARLRVLISLGVGGCSVIGNRSYKVPRSSLRHQRNHRKH